MAPFSPLLGLLAEVPDPRRGQGQKYKLPHVLLFSILAVVTGCDSYRGIVTSQLPDFGALVSVKAAEILDLGAQ